MSGSVSGTAATPRHEPRRSPPRLTFPAGTALARGWSKVELLRNDSTRIRHSGGSTGLSTRDRLDLLDVPVCCLAITIRLHEEALPLPLLRMAVADNIQAGPLPPATPESPVQGPHSARRGRLWLWIVALGFLAGGAYVVGRSGYAPWRGDPPLTGELTVVIRPHDSRETVLLEDPGTVPVRAGSWMTLQVNFNRPMFAYLLRLDPEGKVVPLYPWNNDRVEIADANEAPPVRRPTKVLLSPATTAGWPFGPRGGLETVLLLARRTPIGQDVQLGSLLDSMPPTKMRQREEVAVFGLDRGTDGISSLLSRNRGTEEEAQEADKPLLTRLDRLREHFELIRVVRFAHE